MPINIVNREKLASSKIKDNAISIMEAGFEAIDTKKCVSNVVELDDKTLIIQGNKIELDDYKSVTIIGFGKASSKAAQSLEDILGDYLTGGIVLDKDPLICKRVTVYKGAHPQPTSVNVGVSEKIANLAKGLESDDLAIIVVSGGGSSLLCWPQSECDQGKVLYNDFLSSGGSINELNVLRKHLSGLKGGGLAKMLYPAKVVSLIFCDVPGEHYDTVASGPTYFDETTVEQAQKLLEKYNIKESFELNETPKEGKYFENVLNIPVVSNIDALREMENKAKLLGFNVISLGGECYDDPETLSNKLLGLIAPKTVIIGGGEYKMLVVDGGGNGGRNEFLSATMMKYIPEGSVFISFASDGIDNCSEAAGAIIDSSVRVKADSLSQSISDYLDQYQHDELLTALDARIITGPTEANVSDLFILVTD